MDGISRKAPQRPMTLKPEDFPNSIDELTLADVQLLLDAIRIASRQPQYMNDPELSLRIGWIIGTIHQEVLKRTAQKN